MPWEKSFQSLRYPPSVPDVFLGVPIFKWLLVFRVCLSCDWICRTWYINYVYIIFHSNLVVFLPAKATVPTTPFISWTTFRLNAFVPEIAWAGRITLPLLCPSDHNHWQRIWPCTTPILNLQMSSWLVVCSIAKMKKSNLSLNEVIKRLRLSCLTRDGVDLM